MRIVCGRTGARTALESVTPFVERAMTCMVAPGLNPNNLTDCSDRASSVALQFVNNGLLFCGPKIDRTSRLGYTMVRAFSGACFFARVDMKGPKWLREAS